MKSTRVIILFALGLVVALTLAVATIANYRPDVQADPPKEPAPVAVVAGEAPDPFKREAVKVIPATEQREPVEAPEPAAEAPEPIQAEQPTGNVAPVPLPEPETATEPRALPSPVAVQPSPRVSVPTEEPKPLERPTAVPVEPAPKTEPAPVETDHGGEPNPGTPPAAVEPAPRVVEDTGPEFPTNPVRTVTSEWVTVPGGTSTDNAYATLAAAGLPMNEIGVTINHDLTICGPRAQACAWYNLGPNGEVVPGLYGTVIYLNASTPPVPSQGLPGNAIGLHVLFHEYHHATAAGPGHISVQECAAERFARAMTGLDMWVYPQCKDPNYEFIAGQNGATAAQP